MKTYQDLLDCGEDEKRRTAFLLGAINDHKASGQYKTALAAQKYYDGENPTINEYEKILYDMQGKAHLDMYTANHKIASRFFGFVVDQLVNYLLGNGVTFSKGTDQKRLGRDFDQKVSLAAEYAAVGGVSFGFWNLDHLEIFSVTEFVPLYDEENGALRAGIRWWQLAPDKPLRCTLYELDGYTEYAKARGRDLEILREKRAYILHVTEREMDGAKIYTGENYPAFPIVPLKNNRDCKSELAGRRGTIDALDLCCSNMVNNVDEGNIIYWVLTNCGGMDYLDAEKFLRLVKRSHVAFMDNTNEGAQAEPHTIEAPFEGTQTAIDMLEKKLYQDFQAFDASAVQAGNQTATAIKASYVPLDLKADKFEREVTQFILKILELAGIDDEPSYTRNQIINRQEEIQSVLMAAEYVTAEYITKKLLTVLGDADMVEEILKQQAAENLERFDAGGEEAPDTDEAIDAAEEAVGKTLNGSQTSSLITVIRQLSAGGITEGQAVKILMTSIGVTREEALAILRGEI